MWVQVYNQNTKHCLYIRLARHKSAICWTMYRKNPINFFSRFENLVPRKLRLKMPCVMRIFAERNKIQMLVFSELPITTTRTTYQNKGEVVNFACLCILEKRDLLKIETKSIPFVCTLSGTYYFCVWPVLHIDLVIMYKQRLISVEKF